MAIRHIATHFVVEGHKCPRGLSMWVSSRAGGIGVEGAGGDGGVWSQLGGPWLVGSRWWSVECSLE